MTKGFWMQAPRKVPEDVKSKSRFRGLLKKGVIKSPEDTVPSYYGYKEPLTPIKDGYGYMGVVCGNKEGTHIQCAICGYYFSYLGKHLLTHGTNAVEYKERFGLMKTTSLIGEELRRKRIEAQLNVPKALREKRRRHMVKLGRMNRGRKYTEHEKTKYSLEKKNKVGLCPDQILERIQSLATKMGRTPRMIDYIAHYKTGSSHIIGTYGTWDNAVRLSGLVLNRRGQGHKKYTVELLVTLLQDFYQRHDRWPSWSDVKRGLIPSAWVWSTYFGGLLKAIEIAKATNVKEQN